MLASLLVVFREVLEAGLIIGIVLAATQGVPYRGIWVAAGIASGTIAAALLASCAASITDALDGNGQEVFNAAVLLIASAMLCWHQLWMANHARRLTDEMRSIGRAVSSRQKPLLALAIVVGVAVLREGAEVVMFLYGIAASSHDGPMPLLLGGLMGIGLGALVSAALYRGLIAIPLRRLFSVTGWLIALLAAGMAGQAAATLAGADLIPNWGYQLWDTSWLLSEQSLPGRTLHIMAGYSDRPMGVQLAAYLAILGFLIIGGHVRRLRSHA
jgi:high-affinity iron transporter